MQLNYSKEKEIVMDDLLKKDFDALKKDHENLKRSYFELLEIIRKLAYGSQRLVETQRGAKSYGEKTVATRLKVYYELFGNVLKDISILKSKH